MDRQLWDVQVGGLLAIVGGTFAPWVRHKLARKGKIEDARRQRLHDLIGAVYEHQQWIEAQRRAKMFGDEETVGPDPIARNQTYFFPTFQTKCPSTIGLEWRSQLMARGSRSVSWDHRRIRTPLRTKRHAR